MLKKLQKAVAERARSDRFLEKLVGREYKVMRFRLILGLAQRQPGKVSDAKVAAVCADKTGEPMNRHQARRLRNVVEKLLAPGGIWNG
jgi:hypothetical protein